MTPDKLIHITVDDRELHGAMSAALAARDDIENEIRKVVSRWKETADTRKLPRLAQGQFGTIIDATRD